MAALLTSVVGEMWAMDVEGLYVIRPEQPDRDPGATEENSLYIDTQTPAPSTDDVARHPLFSRRNAQYVNRKIESMTGWQEFQRAVPLFDPTGPETTGVAERKEAYNRFYTAIAATPIWNYMKNALRRQFRKNWNDEEIKRRLDKAWIEPFRRRHAGGTSCGFEHVFIGEYGRDGIGGLHNWIRYWKLETEGSIAADKKHVTVNYHGYRSSVFGQDMEEDPTPYVATIQYMVTFTETDKDGQVINTEERLKATGGFLLGVSLAFDFALYSLIYLIDELRGRDWEIIVDGWWLRFKIYYIGEPPVNISSVYPEVMRPANADTTVAR